MKDLKLTDPKEVEHVKTHLLTVMSEEYRLLGKLTAYIDTDGKTYPLDSWSEIVRRTNLCMKTCVKGRMIKTFFSDDTQQPACVPSGIHIFAVPCEITEGLIRAALRDAHNIYWSPRHRANDVIHSSKHMLSPACNMMFYTGCGRKSPDIRDVFEILFAEVPALARYALIYLRMIQNVLRLNYEDMQTVNLCINHYDPGAAINPHVDTVYPFKGTLGPIFTVAMGKSQKMMDMLPVLLPDSYNPVRIFSEPDEMMLLDGEARTLWAHSKPWNFPHEQYTLVFKCPEYHTKTHDVPFEYEGNHLVIPYHYVSQVKSNDEPLP
jgi:alkylated DNA repair dioxygenase AlkB